MINEDHYNLRSFALQLCSSNMISLKWSPISESQIFSLHHRRLVQTVHFLLRKLQIFYLYPTPAVNLKHHLLCPARRRYLGSLVSCKFTLKWSTEDQKWRLSLLETGLSSPLRNSEKLIFSLTLPTQSKVWSWRYETFSVM